MEYEDFINKRYCLYMHVSPEGLCYIGKTSRRPIMRWTQGNKYRGNKDFQTVIEKYGERNFLSLFEHYILSPECEWVQWEREMPFEKTNVFSHQEAEILEKTLIEDCDTMNPAKGFNRASGGDCDFNYAEITKERNRQAHLGRYDGEKNPAYGMKHTEETKKLLSELAKLRTGEKNPFYGKQHSEEAKERNRQAHIGRYDGEKNPFYGKTHTAATKAFLSELRRKPISMYSLSGQFIKTFPSVTAAAKTMKVSTSSIYACVTKATKTCCKMIWRYYECNQLPQNEMPFKHCFCKSISQYSLQGNFIKTFQSLTEAAKSTGVSATAISNAAKGRTKQSGGYIWRYLEDELCCTVSLNKD